MNKAFSLLAHSSHMNVVPGWSVTFLRVSSINILAVWLEQRHLFASIFMYNMLEKVFYVVWLSYCLFCLVHIFRTDAIILFCKLIYSPYKRAMSWWKLISITNDNESASWKASIHFQLKKPFSLPERFKWKKKGQIACITSESCKHARLGWLASSPALPVWKQMWRINHRRPTAVLLL